MASVGDRVIIKHFGAEYTGILLNSSDSKIYILKLENGYNIGLPLARSKVTIIGKNSNEFKSPKIKLITNTRLPDISLISTGGTIAAKVDYRTGAVHAITKPAELLAKIPELSKIANISVSSPLSIFSEEMNPEHWSKIAGYVARELNKENIRGVVVTHGTDTMHYTAAALSFALEALSKPVALTGGQRSSDRGSFDGAINLICATEFATSDIAEVAIVMHANSSDDYCIANPGTKTKKMHTSMRNTFRPINSVPFAKIYVNGKIEKQKSCTLRHSGKVKVKSKFESKVALIKYHPGLSPKLLDYYLKERYKGIIIEGTGLGHIKTSSWLTPLSKIIKKGIFVGMTSQANYGRVDPYIYSTGRDLVNHGVVYLDDMLPETAIVKLSWVLGQTTKPEEVRHLMTSNLRGEISKRSYPNAFLY